MEICISSYPITRLYTAFLFIVLRLKQYHHSMFAMLDFFNVKIYYSKAKRYLLLCYVNDGIKKYENINSYTVKLKIQSYI